MSHSKSLLKQRLHLVPAEAGIPVFLADPVRNERAGPVEFKVAPLINQLKSYAGYVLDRGHPAGAVLDNNAIRISFLIIN